MKILLFAPGLWIHSKRVLNWLLDSGHEVVFVDKDYPDIGKPDSFLYRSYPAVRAKRYYSFLGKSITNFISLLTILLQLQIIKFKYRPDITHIQWVNKRAFHAVLTNLHPLVLSVLGSDVNKFFESEKALLQERKQIGKAIRLADLVLVDSIDLIEKCQQLADHKANVIFLPIGIDTEKFANNLSEEAYLWRKKLNIEKEALVFVSIRAMKPLYNHHLILEAFMNAHPYFEKPAYLILKDYANRDNDYKTMIKQKIIDFNLGSKIKWIDEKISDEGMAAFYHFSDLIINFPSYDAFPVSFVEAAASARSVLTCSLPAYKNTFADKYFLKVEKGDVEALKYEMISFVNNHSKDKEETTIQAQKWVQVHYDEKVSREKLNLIYNLLTRNQIDQIEEMLTKKFKTPLCFM